MKNIRIFIILITGLYFTSCKKDKSIDSYVKGEIVVGFKNNTKIDEAFNLINGLNLTIDEMSGFYYTSPYPADSIPSLDRFLLTKIYLNARGFSVNIYSHYQTGITSIFTHFFDMNIANQEDWIQTINLLELSDMKGVGKNALIKVPDGEELYWVEKLKLSDIISWAEVNEYVHLVH